MGSLPPMEHAPIMQEKNKGWNGGIQFRTNEFRTASWTG